MHSFYQNRLAPRLYDFAAAAVFAPVGGIKALRRQALDLSGIMPATRVLEIGCGTGGITAQLTARGAVVTGIDGSAEMIARARERAPAATFHVSRIEDLDLSGTYDVVLFAFVLHELDRQLRIQILGKAMRVLASGGRVVILDHGVPPNGIFARAWHALLAALEPPTVLECIAGYDADIAAAGGQVTRTWHLAHGTAVMKRVEAGSR